MVSLKGCFLKEGILPRMNGWLPSVEDAIIPLFPDQPSRNHKDFHEEGAFTILSSVMHHGMEVQIEFPSKTNLHLAFSTEGTREE
jgi:hypothetical protein